MKKIYNLLFENNISDPKNYKLWIPITLIIKLLFFVLYIKFFSNINSTTKLFPNFWGTISPDTYSYFEPIEKLISSKNLRFLFDYRMFGYGIPYYFLRVFFSPSNSLNIIVIIQTILSAISIYLLSILSIKITKKRTSFYMVYLGTLFMIGYTFYDIVALTESLSSSFLIISLYVLILYKDNKYLMISGFFLAWAVFLRPVFFPLFLFFIIFLYHHSLNHGRIRFIKKMFVFLLPIFLFEIVWMSGMYKYQNKIHLTSPTVFHPYYLDKNEHSIEKINLLKALGQDWEQNNWFTSFNSDESYPTITNTSIFNLDSLKILKKELIDFDTISTLERKKSINEYLKKKLQLYTISIQTENKFYYYFLMPIKNIYKISIKSFTHRMFGEYKNMNKKFLWIRVILDSYVWILEFIFVLSLIFLIERKDKTLLFLNSIVVYFYAIHALIFKSIDNRYLIPILPLMLFIIVHLIFKIKSHKKSIKI